MLYLYAPQEADVYQALLSRAMPGREVRVWPEPVDAASVRYAVVWGPPPGFFAGMRRLEAVFVLGAGVDKLMARDDLPSSVAVVRLTDAGMAQQMLEYALYGVLHAQRRMGEYQHQQSAAQWRPLPARLASQTRIGVLGLGEIGGKVAMGLATLGYRCDRRRLGHPRLTAHTAGESSPRGVSVLDVVLPTVSVVKGMAKYSTSDS